MHIGALARLGQYFVSDALAQWRFVRFTRARQRKGVKQFQPLRPLELCETHFLQVLTQLFKLQRISERVRYDEGAGLLSVLKVWHWNDCRGRDTAAHEQVALHVLAVDLFTTAINDVFQAAMDLRQDLPSITIRLMRSPVR